MDDATSFGGDFILLSSDEKSFKVIPFFHCAKSSARPPLGTLSVDNVLAHGGSIVSSKQLDEVQKILKKHFDREVTISKVK